MPRTRHFITCLNSPGAKAENLKKKREADNINTINTSIDIHISRTYIN